MNHGRNVAIAFAAVFSVVLAISPQASIKPKALLSQSASKSEAPKEDAKKDTKTPSSADTAHSTTASPSDADAGAPLVIHPQDLITSERFVAELKNSASESVCLYKDGAIICVNRSNKDAVTQDGVTFDCLSTSVDDNSIMISPPESATITGYYVSGDAEKRRDLHVRTLGESDKDDTWRVQFSVTDVSWDAHSQILMLDDEYIVFVCLIRITNNSGVDIRNAKLLFLADKMFEPNEVSDVDHYRSKYRYTHDTEESIHSGQVRTIVVASSKRIPVSRSSGLFLGGESLCQMKAVKHLQIENWITFPNTAEVSLNKNLPSGPVYVYHTRGEFVCLDGISKMHSVTAGGDVTIRMPSQSHNNVDYSSLDAQLSQESYRILSPTFSEADYRLVVKNPKDVPVLLKVTIDATPPVAYSVERSSMKFEKNKKGEAYWVIEIPARGTKELRYKLTIRTPQASTA
ncbi:MAG: DUF4139 domain-containing protein [Holosporales bacterium]|nr:DUF4139 domain-containing protein [Holosporales bacterium]